MIVQVRQEKLTEKLQQQEMARRRGLSFQQKVRPLLASFKLLGTFSLSVSIYRAGRKNGGFWTASLCECMHLLAKGNFRCGQLLLLYSTLLAVSGTLLLDSFWFRMPPSALYLPL